MVRYEYLTLNYPDQKTMNEVGSAGFKVYHVRADSGGVPYFVYVMREVGPEEVCVLEQATSPAVPDATGFPV